MNAGRNYNGPMVEEFTALISGFSCHNKISLYAGKTEYPVLQIQPNPPLSRRGQEFDSSLDKGRWPKAGGICDNVSGAVNQQERFTFKVKILRDYTR